MSRKLVSIAEAADILDVSTQTLRRWEKLLDDVRQAVDATKKASR